MTEKHLPAEPPANFSTEDFWVIPPRLPDADKRLNHLAEAVYADLDVLSYPRPTWDYSSDNILEVAIIGAGHSGKSAAFGLQRYGIDNVSIFDRSPGGKEGPWYSFARNATLRTPKEVTGGLDWGIANLNFRRWCVACYGEDYWQRIHYIPRLVWATYLDWYGKVLNLPIQNDTDIQDITWNGSEQCFWLQSCHQGRPTLYKARFIIFATGLESAGGKNIPGIVQESLPPHCYHHTMDDLDFKAFDHKQVIIIGGGASAFDNAILLLNAGAKSVDIAIRRPKLTNINRIRWSEWNGFHRHFIDLPDARKWSYNLAEARLGQLPPPHTYYQAINHPRLTLYTDAAIQKLSYENDKIVGLYGDLSLRHDALICGTGFITNLDHQPELRTLAPHIARWQDRFTPPPGDHHAEMAQFPYLDKTLAFTPKSPEHGYVKRCYYLMAGAAMLSGFRANLSGLQFALPRITYDISQQLFMEHQDEIRAAFDAYDVKEY